MKTDLKEKAIGLRREGKTYSEILKDVPVAKSTLSLWFHEVELAKHQVQRITQKRIEGQKKGAEARRKQRIESQEKIWSEAEKEVGSLTDRELWLIGVCLCWAEGSKEKAWRPGGYMKFSNSDPHMIRVFLRWVNKIIGVPSESLIYEIFIHESKRDVIAEVVRFWSRETSVPLSHFRHVYFKKNKINTKRKNIGALYNGQLRVNIPKSTILMRKVHGWSKGIENACRVV